MEKGLPERDSSERGPGREADQRAILVDERFDGSPLAHDYLQLVPGGAGVGAREGDQAEAVVTDRGQLRSVVLDATVPGDGDPPCSGNHGDPLEVPRVRCGDGAGRTVAFVYYTARITWVGDVGTDGCDQLAETQDVGVEVETDGRVSHAARAEISYP